MIKRKGKLDNLWDFVIKESNKKFTITFKKKDSNVKIVIEEQTEMAGFTVNDYSNKYLNYIKNNALGIKKEDTKFTPTKY